jgi:hypothetical protein
VEFLERKKPLREAVDGARPSPPDRAAFEVVRLALPTSATPL